LIIFIAGATASGKTALATILAKQLNTSIVSADSMQIYKGMDIGTAKETDEILGVRQYCVDMISPKENFTVVDYRNVAEKAIIDIESQNKTPIVVGGTGYYISSLMFEMSFGFGTNKSSDIRMDIEQQYNNNGIDALYSELERLDPDSANKIHKNNTRRVMRALEIVKTTGIPYSKQDPTDKYIRDDILLYILSSSNRAKRNDRISSRVEYMFQRGLQGEVESLISSGVEFDMQSMHGIGYKEWQGYFNGKSSLDDVKDLIKKNTRSYAKRQDTWFNNKYEIAKFIDVEDQNDLTIDKIVQEISNYNIK
jgi:tRNA dimethylallyltransferase